MAPESDSDRDAKLAELSRWHTKPEENTEYSDYNLHYVDVEASAEAEDEYMMRAREIMGLDPVTGLPVDRKE